MGKFEVLSKDFIKELEEDAQFANELSEPPTYWEFQDFIVKYKESVKAIKTLRYCYLHFGWLNYKELVKRGILHVYKNKDGERPQITSVNHLTPEAELNYDRDIQTG